MKTCGAPAVRAYNTMAAELFRPYLDRFAPVAVVHRWTPQEAIDEATYAVKTLGFKAIVVNGAGMRSVPDSRSRYVDCLGLDNAYDFDPFFQTCVDLGVAITSHGGALTWPHRASVTNFVFNHIGHFAEANASFAKAVFLGGVARRFPSLNFGFLEGGAGWAANLYIDLVGHWEKRHPAALNRYLRPDNLDLDRFKELRDRYGHERTKQVDVLTDVLGGLRAGAVSGLTELTEREADFFDDFAASGVTSKADITQMFTRNFYFGCEPDDRTAMWAFDPRLGARLRPVFSSDLSHWDSPVLAEIVPEAYELVEKGFLTEDDFRDFAFANAVRLHGGMNPDFFKGSPVEQAAAEELDRARPKLVA